MEALFWLNEATGISIDIQLQNYDANPYNERLSSVSDNKMFPNLVQLILSIKESGDDESLLIFTTPLIHRCPSVSQAEDMLIMSYRTICGTLLKLQYSFL